METRKRAVRPQGDSNKNQDNLATAREPPEMARKGSGFPAVGRGVLLEKVARVRCRARDAAAARPGGALQNLHPGRVQL